MSIVVQRHPADLPTIFATRRLCGLQVRLKDANPHGMTRLCRRNLLHRLRRESVEPRHLEVSREEDRNDLTRPRGGHRPMPAHHCPVRLTRPSLHARPILLGECELAISAPMHTELC